MADSNGALAGVRILDLTDERGIYGAKLLADLGADVVRPEPPDGDPLRKRGPVLDGRADDPDRSLWYAFFASSRRFFGVDPATDAGRVQLARLVERADVVLAADGAFAVADADLERAVAERPDLVVVDVSSFGRSGPWRDFNAPDLIAGALGGAVATTGDADTPPLKSFGELNFMVSGVYAAIAALSGLYHTRETGDGQRIDVPVHECIASCLEHVFMWYWYQYKLPSATGPVLPRRASLHWSNAYTVMKAKTGSIMITPTPDFEAQLLWLIQEDVHEDLIDPKYQEPENLPLLIQRMMQILTKWVATKDAEQLFHEAQERHSPYGWVQPLEKVADNPQLDARNWWESYTVGDTDVKGPGAPFHFSDTTWRLTESAGVDADTKMVLAELGWSGDEGADR